MSHPHTAGGGPLLRVERGNYGDSLLNALKWHRPKLPSQSVQPILIMSIESTVTVVPGPGGAGRSGGR